jgi:hypothetical protein
MSALLSGCVSDGVQPLSSNGAASIAFESIDGLPQDQFTRLVRYLSDEAKARDLPVVTRDSASQFRARGYASAQVRGKRTIIAWVWDIYDARQQRALRVSGEASSANRRGWAAADDQVLRGIARESLSRLAEFLRNPGGSVPPAPTEPPETGPAVAVATPGPAQQASSLQTLAAFDNDQ